jgi:hypothetical protein
MQATNGPFAETREQLGGYYLIEAKDLDAAIGCQSAFKFGSDAVLVQLHSILRRLVWPEADRFCRGRTFAV